MFRRSLSHRFSNFFRGNKLLKINWKFSAIFALVIALLPFPVLANAGTPLMWAGISHLLLGNAIIGSVEAFLLTKLFRTRKWPSVWLLYAANYISAWVGALLILPLLPAIAPNFMRK